MTLTAAATVPAGTYALTVKGAFGSVSSSTTIQVIIPKPSFSLTAAQSSVTVLDGGAKVTDTITITNAANYTGAVALSAAGMPTGVTAQFSTTSATTSSTLTFGATATATPGTYPILVKGSYGTVSSTVTVTLTVPVPSFTVATSVNSLTVLAGSAGSVTVNVVKAANLGSNVALSVAGLPTGVSATFSPTTTITTSVMKLTAATTVKPGAYSATVKGVFGSVTSEASVQITVPTPSFAVVPAQNSATVLAGGPGVGDAIAIANPANFVGAVKLALSGLPAGLTGTLGTPNAITASSLTFTAAATVTPGTYPIAVTGTFGVATNTAIISLTIPVPSFSLAPSASALTLLEGSSAQITVAVNKPSNLGSNVALSVSGLPTGVTATFSSYSTLTTSVMTMVAAATAPAGTYTVTVKGTFGSIVNTAIVQITIPAASFGMAASQAAISLTKGSANSATMISATNPTGIGGKISLTITGLPTGMSASFSPSTIAPSGSSTLTLAASQTAVAGTYKVLIKGTFGAVSSIAEIQVTCR